MGPCIRPKPQGRVDFPPRLVIEPVLVVCVEMALSGVFMGIVVPEDWAIFRTFDASVVVVRSSANLNSPTALLDLEELQNINEESVLTVQAALDNERVWPLPVKRKLISDDEAVFAEIGYPVRMNLKVVVEGIPPMPVGRITGPLHEAGGCTERSSD